MPSRLLADRGCTETGAKTLEGVNASMQGCARLSKACGQHATKTGLFNRAVAQNADTVHSTVPVTLM
jgi:hypothetical protein